MLDFLTLSSTSAHPQLVSIVYSILLCFMLTSLLALTYRHTYQGLSYSRNFLQTLILAGIVACVALQAIGDSLARGLGMMGALSMIRFRVSLREPRDLIFIFSSLAVGVAAGVHTYALAVAGTLGICAIAYLLYRAPFSAEMFYDGLLRFNLERKSELQTQVERILDGYCKQFALVTLRESAQGDRVDFAYQVKLRSNKKHADLLEAIGSLPSAKGTQMLLQESTIEV